MQLKWFNMPLQKDPSTQKLGKENKCSMISRQNSCLTISMFKKEEKKLFTFPQSSTSFTKLCRQTRKKFELVSTLMPTERYIPPITWVPKAPWSWIYHDKKKGKNKIKKKKGKLTRRMTTVKTPMVTRKTTWSWLQQFLSSQLAFILKFSPFRQLKEKTKQKNCFFFFL